MRKIIYLSIITFSVVCYSFALVYFTSLLPEKTETPSVVNVVDSLNREIDSLNHELNVMRNTILQDRRSLENIDAFLFNMTSSIIGLKKMQKERNSNIFKYPFPTKIKENYNYIYFEIDKIMPDKMNLRPSFLDGGIDGENYLNHDEFSKKYGKYIDYYK